jgi:hypothetical protein
MLSGAELSAFGSAPDHGADHDQIASLDTAQIARWTTADLAA